MRTLTVVVAVAVVAWVVLCCPYMSAAADADTVIQAPASDVAYRTGAWSDFVRQNISYRDHLGREMDSLRRALQAKAPEEWTSQEVDKYLEKAFRYVHHCLTVADMVYRVELTTLLPGDMRRLVEYNWVPVPPLNPLNGWEPMELYSLKDGFHPGDLFIEYASPEWWMGGYTPSSYVIGIYGENEEVAPVDISTPMSEEIPWVVVPSGTLLTSGAYTQTGVWTEYKTARGHS